MNTYLVVQVKERETVTPLQRKKYITSLYGERHTTSKETLGFFEKFSYALGYKKHQNNLDYVTPMDVVADMFYTYPDGGTIFEFYIPKGITTAFDVSYSFENGEIGRKWANFLSKVFPELEVDIKVTHELPNREVWLTSYFFKCIENFPVSIETSVDTQLTQSEIANIKKVVKLYKDEPLTFKLVSHYCETCAKRNPDKPFHVELDYWYNNAESEKTAIDLGLKYDGPTCFFCNELIENEEENTCESCKEEFNGKIIMEVN